MKVLVLNAGSSSQKSCLYDLPEGAFPETAAEPIWEAMVDWGIHPDYGQLTVTAQGTEHEIRLSRDTPNHGLEEMLATLVQGGDAGVRGLDGDFHRGPSGGAWGRSLLSGNVD